MYRTSIIHICYTIVNRNAKKVLPPDCYRRVLYIRNRPLIVLSIAGPNKTKSQMHPIEIENTFREMTFSPVAMSLRIRMLTMDPSLGTATTSIVQNTTGAMLARQAHARPNSFTTKKSPKPRVSLLLTSNAYSIPCITSASASGMRWKTMTEDSYGTCT